jgi:hypothetical protein
MDFSFLLRGLIIGFAVAAPVGPIGVLCIRRTLAAGRVSGFVSGLGVATADALYGCIAGFGLTFVSRLLDRHQVWLHLARGRVPVLSGGQDPPGQARGAGGLGPGQRPCRRVRDNVGFDPGQSNDDRLLRGRLRHTGRGERSRKLRLRKPIRPGCVHRIGAMVADLERDGRHAPEQSRRPSTAVGQQNLGRRSGGVRSSCVH